ncbi:type VI secretion system baseplate subunit TssE [Halopseudomonas maritima]|uniref:type VI secretion system baseplate subunit TssE n=1 Tax=Halopseudomonas maritima TaxID=2918528 RepID=UPI001EECB4CD|nr:type VI secretion system baseplate subunit TssE [Halopseudomonas maritima]UJJ31322.1 type VI secretion system baseplate subunit TssE [Halopseudomonas maritima]
MTAQPYGTLFERLGGKVEARRTQSREASVSASIANHLARLLSTRAGSVQMLPDYGLPELNDMRLSLHDTRQQARAAIERFITRYEPRLQQVRVVSHSNGDDPLHLTFDIHARLNMAELQHPVRFCVQLDGQGQTQVEQTGTH